MRVKRLGKVTVDFPPMEDSYEDDGILFDSQTHPIISNPEAVIGAASPQLLKARNVSQGLCLLDIFNQGLESTEEGFVFQGSQVSNKTPFEADLQGFPSRLENTSFRLASAVA
jgi:hypothetical protein